MLVLEIHEPSFEVALILVGKYSMSESITIPVSRFFVFTELQKRANFWYVQGKYEQYL